MIERLEFNTFELKLCLDARQVLEDELLTDWLVDLAVWELQLLELPGFLVSLSFGHRCVSLEAFLTQGRGHGLMSVIHA